MKASSIPVCSEPPPPSLSGDVLLSAPGIQAFLRETVKNCQRRGYVQTLMGRRRYLPAITNGNGYAKAHVSRACSLSWAWV